MKKNFTRLSRLALWAISLGSAAVAQAAYVPVPLTGFNTDVVANGVAAVSSTTTYDVDGSGGTGYAFMAPDYRNPSAPGTAPTRSLPASGLITSLITSGVTYQLADYGTTTANSLNALRLPATGNSSAATGTVSFVTPQAAGEVYILALSGAAASTVVITINFTDGTTQVVASQSVADWYTTTAGAYQGFGRVSRNDNGIDNATTTTPRMRQVRVAIDAANTAKQVQSVTFNKTSTTGVLNVLAVSINNSICTGTPTGGTAVASVASVCASGSSVLSLTGASTDLGTQYQWERSTDGGNTWSAISGATSATYTVSGQIVATQYRAQLTCAASGLSAPSAAATVNQNNFLTCYCTVTSNGTNEYIAGVSLNTLNNQTNANSSGGYGNFTTNAALTTTLNQGGNYPLALTVRVNSSGAQGAVWIDYDHSGTFDASEYFLVGTSSGSATITTLNNTLSIPATALLGQTRMRVRWRNGPFTNANACLSGTGTWFGETEDYLVTIDPSLDCTGTPPATTVTSTTANACPNTPFTLSAAGVPVGTTGLSYQWQSGPAGAGTFTDLGSAQTTPDYLVANQTAATDYRVVVTCTAASLSTTSSVLAVGQSNFLYCYCSPSSASGGEYFTNITLNTLSNSSGSSTTTPISGYADYTSNTALTTTLTQTGTYTVSVTAVDGRINSQALLWIDYDHSGTFDASEYLLVGSGPTSGSFPQTLTFSNTFTVPATALTGLTRLRIRWHNDNNSTDPCGLGWNGETEDYFITIDPSLACAGAPTAATAAATATSVCSGTSFTLSATGIAAGTTGLSYQWQSSPAGAGTFTNLGSAQTTTSYPVASQSAATDYRLLVTCTASSQSTPSSIVSVAQNSFLTCYCTPTGGSCTSEWVRGVTLNTLSNLNTTCTTGGYADYTGNAALTTTLAQNVPYPISLDLRLNATASQAGVWIDYDHSGTFDASEYTLLGTGPTSNYANLNTTFSGTINVPTTALLGQTRMRVRSNNGSLGGTQACSTGSTNYYGEVEDYFVTITASSACTGTPTAGTAASTVSTVCPATAFNLSVTGYTTGVSGLAFQWESSPAGANTYAPISGATTATYTVASQAAATDYRVAVTCTTTSLTDYSAPVSVAQTSFTNCYCLPTYSLGGSTDVINTVTVGALVNNTTSQGNTSPYYHDYSASQPGSLAIPDMAAGATTNVVLTFGADGNQYSGVWVDFNRNGIFESSEFFSTGTNAGANGTATIPVAVPGTVQPGQTKMRIRGGNDAAVKAAEACGTSTNASGVASNYGEAEDYLVNLTTTAPLPVELTRFSVTRQGTTALLTWATASERQNVGFGIEVSADGAAFKQIGFVEGAGTSTTARRYAYTDARLTSYGSRTVYYRLRQLDQDGTAHYSPVQLIKLDAASTKLVLYPNPARTALTVAGATAGSPIEVFDALGRLVLRAAADAAGTAQLALPSDLPQGVYVVRTATQAARLVVE